MIVFWMSVAGLGLLALMWVSTLIRMIRQPSLPEFTIDDPAPGERFEGVKIGAGAGRGSAGSLSIIIPARNEVRNIETCVRAVLAIDWPQPLELIVVDDRSTDGTGERLAQLATGEPRLKIVEGRDPPPGWLGKPHALHLGQQHANGDWLLFIDADVRLQSAGPRRLVAKAIEQGADMASALGRLQVESFWERVVQTRIGAIIAGGNPLDQVNDPKHERALANGQCMLFSRLAYDRLGGHAAIRSSVLDDVDFAKRAKDPTHGVTYRLYHGPGVFSCRMYAGLNEIWNGWAKNLFPALGYSLLSTFIVVSMIFMSSLLPFVLLGKNLVWLSMGREVEPVFLWMETAICGVIFTVDAVGHAINRYRWGLFWTFPIGISITLLLFINSAWRIKSGRGAVWKGRVVEAGIPASRTGAQPPGED